MNIVESNGDVKLCASTSVKLEVFGCGETFGHCAYKPVRMSHNAYNAYNACNVRKCESAKVRKCESDLYDACIGQVPVAPVVPVVPRSCSEGCGSPRTLIVHDLDVFQSLLQDEDEVDEVRNRWNFCHNFVTKNVW